MFSRIRNAAAVLSYSPPKMQPHEQPDIIFQDEERGATKTSAMIGTFIEVLLIATVIGIFSGPVMHLLLAGKQTASVLTVTGFTASLLSIIGFRFFEKINNQVRLQLKIGERIAPYFGHKITRAINIIRG